MKTGVSSYSYSRLVNSGKLDFFEMIDKAAETGFDAIEFSGLPAKGHDERIELAGKIRKRCSDAGLSIANYATAADLLKGSGGNREAEIERVKKEVLVANALGVDKMRHDSTFGFNSGEKGARSFGYYLGHIAHGCREITGFAAEHGIRTMVENHGRYSQDSERIEMLVNEVDDDNFGVLLDVGNFMCVDEDPVDAVGRLISYAFHVHFKDFHVKDGSAFNPGPGWFYTRYGTYLRGAIVGHGDLPLSQCMNIIKQYGYDGTLSIEFEGLEEPLFAIETGYKNLRRLISSVEF
ncbi:MAG: sugar phosphate isomerase/epimerase [Clostridia bacterium]